MSSASSPGRGVYIYGKPYRHRVSIVSDEDDPRIIWTVCGIRFVWGHIPGGIVRKPDCPICWT